jgi:hypothetical protein
MYTIHICKGATIRIELWDAIGNPVRDLPGCHCPGRQYPGLQEALTFLGRPGPTVRLGLVGTCTACHRCPLLPVRPSSLDWQSQFPRLPEPAATLPRSVLESELPTVPPPEPSWHKAKAVSRPIWSGRHGFNSCHPQQGAQLLHVSGQGLDQQHPGVGNGPAGG